ncbi:hypothetical protein PBI_SMEAGOL_73 [Mycobacterium phage Smeagol]|nr:hypothetical protein PBI_SMEAGOL_73 [Mycobacterium phage Smeagol]
MADRRMTLAEFLGKSVAAQFGHGDKAEVEYLRDRVALYWGSRLGPKRSLSEALSDLGLPEDFSSDDDLIHNDDEEET